jgi:ribose-phosphate pyrophosphokinase
MSAEMANEIKLISGRSHPELSGKIAKRYPTTRPHPTD